MASLSVLSLEFLGTYISRGPLLSLKRIVIVKVDVDGCFKVVISCLWVILNIYLPMLGVLLFRCIKLECTIFIIY